MIHQFSALQWKSCRWQLPILPRRTNSIDVIYERSWVKVQSNSHNGIQFIGRQVRIKSNSSLSQKRSAINYNNNCCESTHSEESHRSFLSTSNDSLTSFEDGPVENINAGECTLLPINLNPLMNPSESGGYVNSCPSSVSSWCILWCFRGTYSKLSEVNDKLDANIAMAETLLSMLNSFDCSHTKNSSAMKLDLFHMHIRQFLIEFDARIRLAQRRKQNTLHQNSHFYCWIVSMRELEHS